MPARGMTANCKALRDARAAAQYTPTTYWTACSVCSVSEQLSVNIGSELSRCVDARCTGRHSPARHWLDRQRQQAEPCILCAPAPAAVHECHKLDDSHGMVGGVVRTCICSAGGQRTIGGPINRRYKLVLRTMRMSHAPRSCADKLIAGWGIDPPVAASAAYRPPRSSAAPTAGAGRAVAAPAAAYTAADDAAAGCTPAINSPVSSTLSHDEAVSDGSARAHRMSHRLLSSRDVTTAALLADDCSVCCM